jgi:hypothetical protein
MATAEQESSTQRSRGAMRDPVRVLDTIKRDAITALGGVLSGFWGTIEEQVRLTALAGHDYSAAQDDRMAVTALSQRALELATRYRQSLEREFEHWLQAKEPQREDKSLSLMSEGELEVHLAGQQTTELLDHQFLHPLELLDERLQALAHALGSKGRRANPLRPEAAVAAFVGLFGPDDLTPGLRPLVFHQFDKRLPHILGDLYGKLNSMLEAAGFGFSLPSEAPARTSARPASAHRIAGQSAGDEGLWVPEGGVVERAGDGPEPGAEAGAAIAAGGRVFGDAQDAGRPPRYRDVVREQLRHWRARRGGGAAGAAGLSAMPGSARQPSTSAGGGHRHAAGKPHQVLRTEDLLSVAQILQGDDPAPFTHALATDDARALSRAIREEILGGVRQLGFNPVETHFSIDEEDAIDLVGILFQSLFEANDLLQESRGLYGRLVVPYLKVALTDDSLFNRRSHPARQLLDVLTEACDGNAGETPQDRETLDRAERAVDRVVAEYQDDQAIFELAASELRDQLEQQRRRAELAEKRAAEAIHGRERLQQARRDAIGLVASRMSGRKLTAPVAHFLDRHWRHHLTQVWLREGVESERHRTAIGIGDAMVQVDADAAQARGRAVADQLLALQVPLGECYASCGMDAGAARDAMARIIAALAIPDAPRSEHAPEPLDEDDAADESKDAGAGLHLAGGTATLQFDPTIAMRMRRLRVGQGLRLIDEHGHETAGRIAWISPMTARFLIVNRRGVRKLVVSPEELAAMVGSGRAVVRSVDAPFDEAMKQLWQHLNEGPEQDKAARTAS